MSWVLDGPRFKVNTNISFDWGCFLSLTGMLVLTILVKFEQGVIIRSIPTTLLQIV